jgi:hypothetical protein
MVIYNIAVVVNIVSSEEERKNHKTQGGRPRDIKRKQFVIDVDLDQDGPHNF